MTEGPVILGADASSWLTAATEIETSSARIMASLRQLNSAATGGLNIAPPNILQNLNRELAQARALRSNFVRGFHDEVSRTVKGGRIDPTSLGFDNYNQAITAGFEGMRRVYARGAAELARAGVPRGQIEQLLRSHSQRAFAEEARAAEADRNAMLAARDRARVSAGSVLSGGARPASVQNSVDRTLAESLRRADTARATYAAASVAGNPRTAFQAIESTRVALSGVRREMDALSRVPRLSDLLATDNVGRRLRELPTNLREQVYRNAAKPLRDIYATAPGPGGDVARSPQEFLQRSIAREIQASARRAIEPMVTESAAALAREIARAGPLLPGPPGRRYAGARYENPPRAGYDTGQTPLQNERREAGLAEVNRQYRAAWQEGTARITALGKAVNFTRLATEARVRTAQTALAGGSLAPDSARVAQALQRNFEREVEQVARDRQAWNRDVAARRQLAGEELTRPPAARVVLPQALRYAQPGAVEQVRAQARAEAAAAEQKRIADAEAYRQQQAIARGRAAAAEHERSVAARAAQREQQRLREEALAPARATVSGALDRGRAFYQQQQALRGQAEADRLRALGAQSALARGSLGADPELIARQLALAETRARAAVQPVQRQPPAGAPGFVPTRRLFEDLTRDSALRAVVQARQAEPTTPGSFAAAQAARRAAGVGEAARTAQERTNQRVDEASRAAAARRVPAVESAANELQRNLATVNRALAALRSLDPLVTPRQVQQAAFKLPIPPPADTARVTPTVALNQLLGADGARLLQVGPQQSVAARVRAAEEARARLNEEQARARIALTPLTNILGHTEVPARLSQEEQKQLASLRQREAAVTDRLVAAEERLAAIRAAEASPAAQAKVAQAQRRVERLNRAQPTTPEAIARHREDLATAEERLADARAKAAERPGEKGALSAVAKLRSQREALVNERAGLSDAQALREGFDRDMAQARAALANIGQAAPGPAMSLLRDATRRRVDSLNAEDRLSRATLEEKSASRLQSFYAGGGRGGIRGPGVKPGGEQPLSPGEAFLGGLTSRGFNAGGGFRANFSGLAATAGTLIKYGVLSGAIYGVASAFGNAKGEVVDYIDSLTDLTTALDTGTTDFGALRHEIDNNVVPSLEKLSRLSGANVGESLDAMTRGVRAFTSSDSSQDQRQRVGIKSAEVANQLAVITGGTVKDKTGDLIAIGEAFGFAGNQLDQITDAIANARSMGGDLNQISQGLANFAEVAGNAGVNAQEAANLISVVQARTDQSGQAVATRLARITQIMGTAGNQDILKRYGVDTSAGFLEQLRQLEEGGGGKRGLKDAPLEERKAVVSRLAGTANVKEFDVALEHADEVIKKSIDDMAKAGAGADLYGRKNADLAGLFRKISGDLKNIIVNLQRSDIGLAFGVALQILEPVLHTVSDLIGAVAQLPSLLTKAASAVLAFGAAWKVASFYRERKALAAPLPVGGVPYGPTEGPGAYVLGTPGATKAALRGKVPVHPGVAAETAVAREELGKDIAKAQVAAATAQVANATAVAENRQATAAFKAAEAEQARVRAMGPGLVSAEALQAADIGRADAALLVARTEMEAATSAEAITAARKDEVATTEALVVTLNRLAAANAVLTESNVAEAASEGAATGARGRRTLNQWLWSTGRGGAGAGGAGAGGAGAGGALSGVSTLTKVMGAAFATYIGVSVVKGIHDAISAGHEANRSAAQAYGGLYGATSVDERQKAITALRESGEQYKDAARGGFNSFVDDLGQIFAHKPGRNQVGLDLISRANQEQAELDKEKKRQAVYAATDNAKIFKDFTLEGMQESFDNLNKSGVGAKRSMDLLSQAFGDVYKNVPDNTVLPHRAEAIKASVGALADPFGGALSEALVGTYEKTGQPDIYKAGATAFLRDITPLWDDPEAQKHAAAQRKKLDKGAIKKREAELQSDPAGLHQYQEEIAQARKEVADYEISQMFSDKDKTDKLGNTVRSHINEYFTSHNITEASGGVLTDAQQQELATQVANDIADASGYSGKKREELINQMRTKAAALLKAGLDHYIPYNDQTTSDAVAQWEATQAKQIAQALTAGDADAIQKARSAQVTAQQALATATPAKRPALLKTISDARQAEAAAYVPADPVEAQRTRLAYTLQAEQHQIRAHTEIDVSVIQDELEARRDLAAAIEEGIEARIAMAGYSADPVKAAATNLKVARQREKYLANLAKNNFKALGADVNPDEILAASGDPTAAGKIKAGDVVGGWNAVDFVAPAKKSGEDTVNAFVAGAAEAAAAAFPPAGSGAQMPDWYYQAMGMTPPTTPTPPIPAHPTTAQDDLNEANKEKGIARGRADQNTAVDAAKKRVNAANRKRAKEVLNAAQMQARTDTEAKQDALAAAQLAEDQAKVMAGVDARSSEAQLNAQLTVARMAQSRARSLTERYQATAQVNQLQEQQWQQQEQAATVANQAARFPGDTIGAAKDAIRSARDRLNHYRRGSIEYNQALIDLHQSQMDLAAAQRDAAKVRFLLGHDITNPLVQAEADTRAARQKLRDDRKAGADKATLRQDRLDVRTAENAEAETKFRQRFDAAATADRLGRISHVQYMRYLQHEHDRLMAIKHRTYQQQQDLNDVDSAIQAAKESMQGQFNIGDIKLPTPYEVRRFIAAQANAATAGQYGQGATQNVTIVVNGANHSQVEGVLAQHFGPLATGALSSAPKK